MFIALTKLHASKRFRFAIPAEAVRAKHLFDVWEIAFWGISAPLVSKFGLGVPELVGKLRSKNSPTEKSAFNYLFY